MGKKFSHFISKTILFKLLAVVLLFSTYKLLENSRFEQVDYFLRDALQYLNSAEEVDKSFVTLNMNINSDGITMPHTYEGMKKIIDKLQTATPKSIILMMEPLDFSTDPTEKKKLFRLFQDQQNLYINKYEARNEFVSFAKDEVFKNFPRTVTFDRCVDSPKNRESRRAFLSFNSFNGRNDLIDYLKVQGYNPKSISDLKYKFEYWNTLQAYIKSYPLGTFGNYQSHDLLNNRLPNEVFSNKTVIIGTNNEFSMLTSKSVFSMLSNKWLTSSQEIRIPLQDVFANIMSFHTTGNYIKFLKNFDDLGLSIFALALIVFSRINLTSKLYTFLLMLPAMIFVEVLIYKIDSFYVDISRSIILFAGLQYLALPIFLLNQFKRLESSKLVEINNARIDALLAVSSSIAHDLRSPLSTITLMISKAHFQNVEHRNLITSSINRLNAIIENLLRKHTSDTSAYIESINLTKLIHHLVSEKTILAPDVLFKNDIDRELLVKGNLNSLERALSNIFDNSIEATNQQESKLIQIEFKTYDHVAELIISDNGPGIPKAVLSLLGVTTITTKKDGKGNGIGLLSSIRLIEKMNGQLTIISPESGGTKVQIKLPKCDQ